MFTYLQYQRNKIIAERRLQAEAKFILELIESILENKSRDEFEVKFPVIARLDRRLNVDEWHAIIDILKLGGWDLTVMPREDIIETKISIQPIEKPRWK